MLETTPLISRTFEQSSDQMLADLALKRNRHLLIQLNQENKVYAQVLDTKLHVIQEIAEQNIYFGVNRQQGEPIIQALREIKHSDIQTILHPDKLTLLVKHKQQNCVTKIVKDAFKGLQDCFCCCCSCLYCCCCFPCKYFLASPPPSPKMQQVMESRAAVTGVITNPFILRSFSRAAFSTETVINHEYLECFVEEALEFVEELSRNTTYETDELQDTLTLIDSICAEDKKQALKVYSENLDSILKNEEETKKFKLFLQSIKSIKKTVFEEPHFTLFV